METTLIFDRETKGFFVYVWEDPSLGVGNLYIAKRAMPLLQPTVKLSWEDPRSTEAL